MKHSTETQLASAFRTLFIAVLALAAATPLAIASEFDPEPGNFWTHDVDGYQVVTRAYRCAFKVDGYTVVLMKSPQDPYGGGVYLAHVPGAGLCEIGADSHDAITGEYMGISLYQPPYPVNGTLEYGDPVGTSGTWIGYNSVDGEAAELIDKETWEVIGYEDVTVPFGTFVNAMKVEHKVWCAIATYVDGQPVPDGDWQFEPSCSEYLWWVPCVGMVKSVDFEGFETMELVNCKVGCPVIFDPTPVDLSLTLSGSKLPSAIVAGNAANISLIAAIQNTDTRACQRGTTVDVIFYLQKAGLDERIQIGQMLNYSVSNLAPGKIKKLTARLILPDTIEPGGYHFAAEMGDTTTVLDDHLLTVADPFTLLKAETVPPKLPAAMVKGTSVKASVQATIVNHGNVPIPAGEMAHVEIVIQRVIDANDVKTLAELDVAVGKLAPAKSKKANMRILIGADMLTGSYVFKAYLNGTEQGDVGSIDIAEPFISLQPALSRSTLPPSLVAGSSVRSDILLTITNNGNIPTPKGHSETITVIAREAAGSEIPLGTYDWPLSNIAPSKSKNVKLPVTFDSNVPEGEYTVHVSVGAYELVIQPPVTVAQPFIDLQLDSAAAKLPATVIAGTGTEVTVGVTIVNRGNIPTPKSEIAVLEAMAHPLSGGGDVHLCSLNCAVGNLAPSKSKKFSISVPFLASLPEGTYSLVMCLDQQQLPLEPSVEVEEPCIELTPTLADGVAAHIFALGGSGNVVFSLEIQNDGTTPTSKSQTIGVAVYGRRQPSDQYSLLGQAPGQKLANLAPGKTLRCSFTVPIETSGGLESGMYDLMALIDSEDEIREEDEEDNWVPLGQANVQVVGGLLDIIESPVYRTYNTTIKGDYNWRSGKGTVESSWGSDDFLTEYFAVFNDDPGGREEYQWSRMPDGAHLTRYKSKNSGYEWLYFDFDSVVLPADFQLKQKYTNTAPATGFRRIYGVEFDFDDGTAQTTCQVAGFETLTIGGTRYETLKVIFSLTVDASGELDLRPYGDLFYETSARFKKDITWWAVPGFGVVKSNTKDYYRLTLSNGAGSEIWQGTENRELITE